jgi:GNAT superfamily N-acetyltransferase
MQDIAITQLTHTPETLQQLSTLLVEAVASGGNVNFMHPLAHTAAAAFWEEAFRSVAAGRRIILGAMNKSELIGTLTLTLDCGQNQPHRCEVAKIMTKQAYRGRGVGNALIGEAERVARDLKRSIIVLTTATGAGAHTLYEKAGFVLAGTIPNFGYNPHGQMAGCMFYWKQIDDVRQRWDYVGSGADKHPSELRETTAKSGHRS